ncbi:magnesium-transporting ATPase (P-type) [Dysgonomonadaceae bacterium PH5-43]|nr:magnesium-transporting ATPase (P-type) [Dysgonomonadaceae bacterium PH5-43]
MNNFFDIKRFGLVLSKDLQENAKNYLMTFLTLFGMLTLILTLMSWSYYQTLSYVPYEPTLHNNWLLGVASFFFLVFGVYYASTTMNVTNNKTKCISYLSFPASNFEKFFSRWLIVTVGFIIAFFVALFLADIVRMFICSMRYPDVDIKMISLKTLVNPSNEWKGTEHYTFPQIQFFILSLCWYFSSQAVFLLGSTFWNKNSFIKTFATMFVIAQLFGLTATITASLAFGSVDKYVNAMETIRPMFDVFDNFETWFMIIPSIINILFCWVLAYFRFTESEIVKRW